MVILNVILNDFLYADHLRTRTRKGIQRTGFQWTDPARRRIRLQKNG